MARRPGAVSSELIDARGPTSTDLIGSDDELHLVENMVPTSQGGLMTIKGPVPYMYGQVSGEVPSSGGVVTPGGPAVNTVYGTVYGVGHTRVMDGQRDILLIITDRQVWEFEGWRRSWFRLAGPGTTNPPLVVDWDAPTVTDYPAAFIPVSNGMVVVPPNGRALFYDGVTIGLLGYDRAPSAPTGMGPSSSSNIWFPDDSKGLTGVNDAGYTVDALTGGLAFVNSHVPSYMSPQFRKGRLGTVDTPGNVSVLADAGNESLKSQVMGYLQPGRFRAKVQYIDWMGNLSPLSPASNDIQFERQPSMVPVGIPGTTGAITMEWLTPDSVKKQVAWVGIDRGPPGTIGRILFRTKDLENSGDAEYYEVPRDAKVTGGAFATLPDNCSDIFPDNIPDSWLNNLPTECQPVPTFRVAAAAAGRLWMGNAPDDEGAVWWSERGKWGTIGKTNKLYPHAGGAAITGIVGVNAGVLALTENSTHLIETTDYTTVTLTSAMGCVAPSSIATTREGLVIWLGRDGFYAYDGQAVKFLFERHKEWARRFNKARLHKAVAYYDSESGEYRCWVSYDGQSGNGTCITFDGAAWHRRTDVDDVRGCCITSDHRSLSVVVGRVGDNDGVWVLDRHGAHVNGTFTTGWLRAGRSDTKGAVRRVMLFLREGSSDPKIQVSVRHDWRSEVVSTGFAVPFAEQVPGYRLSLNPDFWGNTTIGAANWRSRRPYWVSVDVSAGPCDVMQLEITGTSPFELLGLKFYDEPVPDGGTRQR